LYAGIDFRFGGRTQTASPSRVMIWEETIVRRKKRRGKMKALVILE